MKKNDRLIYLHGLMSSSQGDKAVLLRSLFPHMLIPDFVGALDERMIKLDSILGNKIGWKIIGSSFGGLMAALFTHQHPEQVDQLILLAPALTLPDFSAQPFLPITVPTCIYHGTHDELIPLEAVRKLAQRYFTNLIFNEVDDDHRLYQTARIIDWNSLLGC